MSAGKGDTPRPFNGKRFRDGYAMAFGKKPAIQRQTNPTEESVKSLAVESASEIDSILRSAISAFVGDGWVIADMRGRLQSIRIKGQPQETITLDGNPIIELWPIETKTINKDGIIRMDITRKYRTFARQP